MSRETFDSLKDLPRVPHAEGSALSGIQVGVGGNPPERRYVTYGEAVDSATAIARLNARKKGEMPVIPGGLDDHDPRLFVKPSAFSPMSKMKVAQSIPLTAEDVERIKSVPIAEDGSGNSPEKQVSRQTAPVKTGTSLTVPVATVVKPGNSVEIAVPDMGGPAGTVVSHEAASPGVVNNSSQPQPQPQPQPQVVYVEKPVEKVVRVEAETEASRWLKNRVRVEIATDQMTFSISAIAVIRSIHAITLILPTSNDAMTFIPGVGARVKVHPAGGDVVGTIFTGASFDIPELGIAGLAFLVPNS